MALKEKLLENERLIKDCQYEVEELQSTMSYQLGYEESIVPPVNYNELYYPFVKVYADIQLALDNGTSTNPSADRQYAEDIANSVEVVREGLENLASNAEVWMEAVMKSGIQGGLDIMGTPYSRYKAINIINEDLPGVVQVIAKDNDIRKLAWDIYDKEGKFVERIYINKLNKLSETQDIFVSIPDVNDKNNGFKKSNPEIFEQEKMGGEEVVLTGGVTQTYQKTKEDGSLDLYEKPLNGGLVQDFVGIDKEAIASNGVFKLEMEKISNGILEMQESSDPAIAFNNNILAEVTDYYLKPSKALRDNEKKRFKEDYTKWFLEKEINDEMPIGVPRKKAEKPAAQEEVVAEEQAEGQEQLQEEQQAVS